MQEIGLLRQFELRARMLEQEIEKRDRELAEVRRAAGERIRELETRLAAERTATAGTA